MVEEFMTESFNPLNILSITPNLCSRKSDGRAVPYILPPTLQFFICNATNPIIGAKTIIIVQKEAFLPNEIYF